MRHLFQSNFELAFVPSDEAKRKFARLYPDVARQQKETDITPTRERKKSEVKEKEKQRKNKGIQELVGLI